MTAKFQDGGHDVLLRRKLLCSHLLTENETYLMLCIVNDCFRFWPVIDNALRKASLERGVQVRVLASLWNHTKPDMIHFLRSLTDISGAMKADVQVVSVAS